MDRIMSGSAGINSDYCWEENDPYFRAATVGLIDKLNSSRLGNSRRKKVNKEFFFVGLNSLTLNHFLNDFHSIILNNYSVVIICSLRLLPLAAYYLAEHRQVYAVFGNTCSVEDIVATLRRNNNSGRIIIKPRPGFDQSLTSHDVFILRYYMRQGDISFLLNICNAGKSTCYNWRLRVARKFGVRKLEHLLLPDW